MPRMQERLQIENRVNLPRGVVLAMALCVGVLACKGAGRPAADATARAAAPQVPSTPVPAFSAPILRPSARAAAVTGGAGFADMLARVGPAVVHIYATKIQHSYQNPYRQDPFYRYFYRGRTPPPRRQRALGSGVIVRSDGIVLTNHHVIRGADEITVILSDRRELQAKVLGSDPKTDIAVLRAGTTKLPTLPIGDSRAVRVGDLAFAVGSPFGLAQTATFGIVSAVGRGEIGIVDYEDFIQTDAAINPGNSGGALVNARGELIGINTAIISRAGGSQGIGFAVPAQMAKAVMDSILASGHVVRGWLGVAIQDVGARLARYFKLPRRRGVLVTRVEPGSPAAQAGLRAGDLIGSVDGTKTHTGRRLRLKIAGTAPGTRVILKILRDGRERELAVTLGRLPGSEQQIYRTPAQQRGSALAGVEVQPLTSRIARSLGLGAGARGLVVTGLSPSSKAARAGLRRGDVIYEVNRQEVGSLGDFSAAVRAGEGGTLLLLVARRGMSFYVVIDP